MFTNRQINTILSSGKSNILGALGENIVYNALRFYGVKCWITSNYYQGDIATKTAKIEVKTATLGKDSRYRFCLRKNDKYGVTDYRHSDYVLLQAIDDKHAITYYLIPTSDLSVSHITIGKKSKYDKYKTTLATVKDYVQ